MNKADLDWWTKHYRQLEGATIYIVEVVDEGGRHPTPVLGLKMRDGTELMVTVLCDPEGNGAGFIEGLPRNR